MSDTIEIKTIHELNDLLKSYFKEEIKTGVEDISHSIYGRLKGQKFRITYVDNYFMMLFVPDNPSSYSTIQKLQPILGEVMDNKTPICAYNLKRTDTYSLTEYLAIEWDVKHPVERIQALVNERGFQHAEVSDIRLFNSRRIEDYKEDLDWLNNYSNSKVYGRDPGNIRDIEAVKNADEIDLFLMIYELTNDLNILKYTVPTRISYVDMTLSTFALKYMIYQTKKFGVDLPEPKEGTQFITTESYDSWFNYYKKHIIDSYTSEEISAYKVLKKSGKDVSFFEPKGNWYDNGKNLIVTDKTSIS